MAQRRGVRVTVLVEDQSLERFAREVLLELGFHRHEMYVIGYPVGRGSAKQWVEKRYPIEVRAYRSKANAQQIALLVGTEADEQTVAHRFRYLASKLTDAGLADRNDDERVALWVPKWNVETWILYLSGEDVDEQANYRTKLRNPDYHAVAEDFVSSFRKSPSERSAALPSLEVAFKETRRLDS
jgi:hypothetical protein